MLHDRRLSLADDGLTLMDDQEIAANLWFVPAEEVPPLLFRPEDCARVLRVGRPAVFDLIRTHDLRSVKIGSRRRVSAMALRDLVERLEGRESA